MGGRFRNGSVNVISSLAVRSQGAGGRWSRASRHPAWAAASASGALGPWARTCPGGASNSGYPRPSAVWRPQAGLAVQGAVVVQHLGRTMGHGPRSRHACPRQLNLQGFLVPDEVD